MYSNLILALIVSAILNGLSILDEMNTKQTRGGGTLQCLFLVNVRVDFLKRSTRHLPNVKKDAFQGLLVEYMHRKNINLI